MRSSPFANRAKISKMHSLGYTAVAVLLKYFSHAQALGLDCQAALRAAGQDNHLLSDNSRRISGETCCAFSYSNSISRTNGIFAAISGPQLRTYLRKPSRSM